MHGSLRIAVAELFLSHKKAIRVSKITVFERVSQMRRYCLSLSKTDHYAYTAGAVR